jgi:hypothetical protein
VRNAVVIRPGTAISELADEIESRARARLAEITADTTLLDELLSGLKRRAAAS